MEGIGLAFAGSRKKQKRQEDAEPEVLKDQDAGEIGESSCFLHSFKPF